MPADRTFITELEKKLWNAADCVRSSPDASVYEHAVLPELRGHFRLGAESEAHMPEREAGRP
jgi:hypothetical protein